jgi:cytochrome P450
MHTFPVSSLDPFADDFLAAPYPFYAELREAGPVVWLERYGLWACACHAEVQATLSDWQTFSSAYEPIEGRPFGIEPPGAKRGAPIGFPRINI